jgi:hypothetical protein
MTSSRQDALCLWLVLVLPSSFVVHKYLGWGGTIVYSIGVAASVALGRRVFTRLSTRTLVWLVLLASVLVAVAFVVVYPIANTHAAGAGSDDDDALNLGAMALLAGRFPYAHTTYLGNVLHHLPGAFILATPFVALGTSALQNLWWLPIFFLAVREDANSRTALELALVVVALSPEVVYEVVTGTGYLANVISVLLGLWWLVRTTHRDFAAIAWGLTLASRANFLLLVPLAAGYLYQRAGWRTAARAAALTCGTAAALTLPFYVHDPRHFGPLEAANRLLVFNQLLPHLGIALIVLMAALAVGLSFMPMNRAALFRNCAVVQAFPVIAGVVLASVRDRQVNLWYTRYGAFFAWFALMALVTEPSQTPPPLTAAAARARSSSPRVLRYTRTESSSCPRA